ncbi:MAG: inositol monophosphatase [Acidobacteria bacterium]|nr:inositol monophosphatase [Acidobacteriota bacterium]
MHPMLNIAVKAARRAGSIINRASLNLDILTVRHKTFNDLVSEVDRAAEQAIIDVLKDAYPEHAILAEESGTQGDSEYLWIIDPLDGTTNYIHRYPFFATSVAVRVGGEVVAGAVYDPVKDEMFAAAKGHGATLNGAPVRVSSCAALADALLVTGFPFRSMAKLPQFLASLEQLIRTSSGIRRDGSASLDCGYVACGRLDGFWECGLSAWDIAAGALLVEEAGGRVTDFDAGRGFLDSGDIVASPKAIHPTFLAEVQSAFR